MPRPPRVDEAGGLYHALNRGNLRADIFKQTGDFVAFEKLLFEGLQLHQIELFSYQLMSNHYHPIDVTGAVWHGVKSTVPATLAGGMFRSP